MVIVVMVLALAFFVAPRAAVADTEDVNRWPLTFLPPLIFMDVMATAANVNDLVRSECSTVGGWVGIVAGVSTIAYGVRVAVDDGSLSPRLFAVIFAAGGLSFTAGWIALARNDAPPLSVQPARILGEAVAAVTFTANF